MSKRINRFHLERLETRQLMARDTSAALDFDPIFPMPILDPGPMREPIVAASPWRPSLRETLPDTSLPGDITATLINGNLYLAESAGFEGSENGILASQLANGNIRIEGISAAGGAASLINGAAFQEFAVPGSLFVNFGAGKDKVDFAILGNTVKLQSAYINVGVDSAVGDADKDHVSISNLETNGSLWIVTGGSNDSVFVNASKIGDGVGYDRLSVSTGAGGDQVQLRRETEVRGDFEILAFDSLSEVDVDTVFIKESIFVEKNFTARLGGGDDNFLVGDVTAPPELSFSLQVNGSLLVDSGAGDDDVLIAASYVGDAMGEPLTILTGAGADTIVLSRIWAYGLNVQTFDSPLEADADDVLLKDMTIFGDLSAELGGGDDEFSITDPAEATIMYGAMVSRSMLVEMGAGADTVHIEGTTIGDGVGVDSLVIYTGSGADDVMVDFRSIPTANGGSIIPELWGNLAIQTYDSAMENDVDRVTIPVTQVKGDLSVRLGAGDDVFELIGGNHGQNFAVDAGDGNDTGFLGGFVYHEGTINMGEGADDLTLGYIAGADILTLSGGGGVDSLRKTQPLSVDLAFESGWEFINGFPTWWGEIFNPDLGGGVFAP